MRVLAEIAQTDAQMTEHRRGQRRDNKPCHHRVRDGQSEEIRRALIDCGPNSACDKSNQRDPWIGKVQQTEDNGNEQDAKPTAAERNHCAPVEEALEHVLLRQAPGKSNCELKRQIPIRMPSQKTNGRAGRPRHQQAGAGHQQDRHRQKIQRRKKSVETEADVAQAFAPDAVRHEHQRETQRLPAQR